MKKLIAAIALISTLSACKPSDLTAQPEQEEPAIGLNDPVQIVYCFAWDAFGLDPAIDIALKRTAYPGFKTEASVRIYDHESGDQLAVAQGGSTFTMIKYDGAAIFVDYKDAVTASFEDYGHEKDDASIEFDECFEVDPETGEPITE